MATSVGDDGGDSSVEKNYVQAMNLQASVPKAALATADSALQAL